MKPNVLIHGVGHSGTRLYVAMAAACGWNVGKVKSSTREHCEFNRINKLLKQQKDCHALQSAMFDNLTVPWAIKCTRSVTTLGAWMPYFAQHEPFMLYVTRHPKAMAKTFHGEITAKRSQGRYVSELCDLAREQYEAWPWGKVHLTYERVIGWAKMWHGGQRELARRKVMKAIPCVGDVEAAVACVDMARANKSLRAMQ